MIAQHRAPVRNPPPGWAAGAAIGLAEGASPAPAASATFTGLLAAVAGLHVNGMVWRRQEARARNDA